MPVTRRCFLRRLALAAPPLLWLPRAGALPVTINDAAFASNVNGRVDNCLTLRDQVGGTTDPGVTVGQSTTQYAGTRFDAAASITICKIAVPIYNALSGTQDISLAIYSDSGGQPGSLIGNASNPVNAATFPGVEGADVLFMGVSADITAGTTYWVLAINNSAANDSNHPNWPGVNGPTGYTKYDDDGSGTWSTIADCRLKFKLYSST